MKGGKVEIITNDQGNRITPSYVAWNDEERLVGDAAKNQYASNPERYGRPRVCFEGGGDSQLSEPCLTSSA